MINYDIILTEHGIGHAWSNSSETWVKAFSVYFRYIVTTRSFSHSSSRPFALIHGPLWSGRLRLLPQMARPGTRRRASLQRLRTALRRTRNIWQNARPRSSRSRRSATSWSSRAPIPAWFRAVRPSWPRAARAWRTSSRVAWGRQGSNHWKYIKHAREHVDTSCGKRWFPILFAKFSPSLETIWVYAWNWHSKEVGGHPGEGRAPLPRRVARVDEERRRHRGVRERGPAAGLPLGPRPHAGALQQPLLYSNYGLPLAIYYLLPAPFPIPYSVYPIPYSLFPVPNSFFPIPYYLSPITYYLCSTHFTGRINKQNHK